jgi:hypothetical protein
MIELTGLSHKPTPRDHGFQHIYFSVTEKGSSQIKRKPFQKPNHSNARHCQEIRSPLISGPGIAKSDAA